MYMNECPICGEEEKWHFWEGDYEDNIKISPDEGWCEKCGFSYYEHCQHPLFEQIEKFKSQNTREQNNE